MKALLKITLGVLVLSLGLTASTPRAYASNHMTMRQSGSDTSSGCQMRCANSSFGVPATRPDEPEENKDEPAPQGLKNLVGSKRWLTDDSVSQANATKDARLLRPPDLITLNCVYRI